MTRPTDRAFDSGLQAERTALAWRRTALAMSVASVGAARLAAPDLGLLAVVLGALGLFLAALVAVLARHRYRAVHVSLHGRQDLLGVRHAGLPIAAMAGSGVLVGILALGVVLGAART